MSVTKAKDDSGARPRPRDFRDRMTASLPTIRDAYKIVREGGLRGSTAEKDRIPLLRNGFPDVDADMVALTWVGHASYVIRIAGRCVLADPVWSAKLNGVARRLTPPGVAWSQLPRIDAVVISHNHYDHLDWPTIRRLPRDTTCCVPAGLGEWFRQRGFVDVLEFDWWESAEVAGLAFDFVPAHHWSRRGLFDTCRSLWGGWVITDQQAGDPLA
ncbi:MAG: MBL fold metallo-hydrolase, partial [Sciscionella sp.]|nr:MBL fold metallo-hydrolase [Sciscionella sp.]